MRRLAQLNNHEQYLFTFLMNLTSFYIENGRLKKARSVNEDMKRSLAHKERSTVIYETLMADYYQRLISAALGEEKTKDYQEFFTVLEYMLGKNQRRSLEKNCWPLLNPATRPAVYNLYHFAAFSDGLFISNGGKKRAISLPQHHGNQKRE